MQRCRDVLFVDTFLFNVQVRQSEGLHIAASSTAIYAVLATSHLQYESVHKLYNISDLQWQKNNENLRHQHLSWQ